MIFGNREHFAIQCTLEENNKSKSIFGHISIWISKEELGQWSLVVSLITPVHGFQKSIDEHTNRINKKFDLMSKSEIFRFLESTLWGDPEDNISRVNIVKELEKYEQFNICTNFSESFDGESLYLIETKKDLFGKFLILKK